MKGEVCKLVSFVYKLIIHDNYMNKTLQLGSLILINLMELKIFYYLCHRLLNKKLIASLKSIFLIILYGISMGIFAYYVDGYIFRLVFIVLMMSILKVISKKKISYVFIIFIITYLTVIFIQSLVFLLVRAFKIEQVYTFFLVQSITLLIAVVIGFIIPFYKVFDIIQRHILLKLILFLLITIVLISLFYVNYDYSISYLLYFSVFMLMSLTGLCITLLRLSYYTNEIPERLHDVKNMLIGIQMTAHGTSDIDEIRKSLDQCLNLMKLSNQNFTKFQINQEKENITNFIQEKGEQYPKDLTLISNICYEEPNESISLAVIVYMIGVLLDNAIEYTLKQDTEKPIFIEVSVWEDSIRVSVKNMYKKKGTDDIENMFKNGYSTKASDGRGFGLFNLLKLVEDYKGIIKSRYEYNTEYNSNYLILTIDINPFTQAVKSRLVIVK